MSPLLYLSQLRLVVERDQQDASRLKNNNFLVFTQEMSEGFETILSLQGVLYDVTVVIDSWLICIFYACIIYKYTINLYSCYT